MYQLVVGACQSGNLKALSDHRHVALYRSSPDLRLSPRAGDTGLQRGTWYGVSCRREPSPRKFGARRSNALRQCSPQAVRQAVMAKQGAEAMW